MWKIRYYVPLVGFVVPTLVVGYFFVIPRSCIAGINPLTLGFASTIVGSVLTYVAGIRAVAGITCPASMPWRVRFTRYINRQAAMPHGLFGRFLGLLWSVEHRSVNQATLELLAIDQSHDVLEVGCGPGAALQKVAAQTHDGHVLGLDVSATMIRAASKRNRRAITRGRVSVRKVGGTDLGLAPRSFDRIFSVHSIYFWKEPERVIAQFSAALRPGGRVVLAFLPDTPSVPDRFRDPVYRFFSPGEVMAMFRAAGFSETRNQDDPSGHVTWVIANAAG